MSSLMTWLSVFSSENKCILAVVSELFAHEIFTDDLVDENGPRTAE